MVPVSGYQIKNKKKLLDSGMSGAFHIRPKDACNFQVIRNRCWKNLFFLELFNKPVQNLI